MCWGILIPQHYLATFTNTGLVTLVLLMLVSIALWNARRCYSTLLKVSSAHHCEPVLLK